MMDKEILESILDKHKKWMNNQSGGKRANLSRADLCEANLIEVDLRGADLSRADLRRASLNGANLRGAFLCAVDFRRANLYGADLHRVNLCVADLHEAFLYRADLSYADLRGANLDDVNLCGADLYGADLYGAKNINTVYWNENTKFFRPQCPEHGAYIAYKKANGLIVELEIPTDALRSSATTHKCRASKARVISITDSNGNPAGDSVPSNYDQGFIYKIGEVIKVPNFDKNRWNECGPGIHHFMTRKDAIKY